MSIVDAEIRHGAVVQNVVDDAVTILHGVASSWVHFFMSHSTNVISGHKLCQTSMKAGWTVLYLFELNSAILLVFRMRILTNLINIEIKILKPLFKILLLSC